MKLVHPDDVAFVDYLVHMGPRKGMWIGGGAPLSWYRGEPASSDIDLFFEDAGSYKGMLNALDRLHNDQPKLIGYLGALVPLRGTASTRDQKITISKHIETPNAVTFEAHVTKHGEDVAKRYLVQLIHRRWYPTVEELLDDFDITVCQIATNLEEVRTGADFARDVAERRLRLHNVTPSTTKRVIKYWVYGYQPDDAVLERVLSDETQVLEAGNDDY